MSLYGVFAFLPSGPGVPGQPKPRTFIDELEARGYDPATLEFRIRRKTPKET